jgi:hypothetical protein
MAELKTARTTEYRVSQTPEKHRDVLAPITFLIDMPLGPFRFTDYLTTHEAFNIAAALTTAAMKVEETDGVEQDLPF